MNILHLLSQNELTGAEVFASQLCQAQTEAGHRVFVVSDGFHTTFNCGQKRLPIDQSSAFEKPSLYYQLRKYIYNNSIDVIHTHSKAAAKAGYYSSLGLGIPMVSSIHGRQHIHWDSRFKTMFYGDRLLPVCDNLATHLIEDLKISTNRIARISNGFQLPPIDLKSRQNRTQHKTWAWVGRLSGPKGEKLIELLPILKEKIASGDIQKLLIVGGKIENLCDANQNIFNQFLKATPEATHLGHQKDLEAVYSTVDVVIGAGRVAIEALWKGVRVFAVGEAGTPGWIDNTNFSAAMQSNFGDVAPVNSVKLDALKKTPDSAVTALPNLIQKNYSISDIYQKIFSIYQTVLFEKNTLKPIPIWMYHRVVQSPIEDRHRTFITVENLRRHFQFINKMKIETVFFKDLWSRKIRSKNAIILTFDDGYKNNLDYLEPELRHFNLKATVYALANPALKTNAWDQGNEPLLTPSELLELAKSPHVEIGSHGISHTSFLKMALRDVKYELEESKSILETLLKTSVETFAYPYGDYTVAHASLTKEAGYKVAVSTDHGSTKISENPFEVFRVNIFPEETVVSLWKKSRKLYGYYFKLKKLKSKSKQSEVSTD